MSDCKIRVDLNTKNKLLELKETLGVNSINEAIEYLINKKMVTDKNKNDNSQMLKKILLATNQNHKILSLLEEFANSASNDLVITNNTSTINQKTEWFKEAEETVKEKIQLKRTKTLRY